MNRRRCLRIAERLQLPFEQQVGIAIDAARMVSDSAYAVDVLTVCDARPDADLAMLARFFRLAAAEPADGVPAEAAPPEPADTTGWGAPSTGFGSTHPPPPNSAFDEARQAARAARLSPNWMAPGRWLGSDS